MPLARSRLHGNHLLQTVSRRSCLVLSRAPEWAGCRVDPFCPPLKDSATTVPTASSSALSNLCYFCSYSLYSPLVFLLLFSVLLALFANLLLHGFNKQKLARWLFGGKLTNQNALVGFCFVLFVVCWLVWSTQPSWCRRLKLCSDTFLFNVYFV